MLRTAANGLVLMTGCIRGGVGDKKRVPVKRVPVEQMRRATLERLRDTRPRRAMLVAGGVGDKDII